MRRSPVICLAVACVALAVSSCSSVKSLSEGQQRLVSNGITVTNDKKFNPNQLNPYLKQKSNGWSPLMYVYNWDNGKGGKWDTFVHKLGVPPVVFDSTMVESSKENIINHLQYIGYFDSKVDSHIYESGNGKKVKVRYSVTLGKRYPIKDITYEIMMNPEFMTSYLEDNVNSVVTGGSYLNEDVLERESARSASAMRNKGYYDFSKNYFFFEADTVSCPDSARLHVIIRNHTRNESEEMARNMNKYHIGTVSVSYPQNMRFREKVLDNLNTVKSGDLFSEKDINTVYSRFGSINLFNSVNVQLIPDYGNRTVDCNINLQQGKKQGFKVGLEASVNSSGLFGISPEISYFNRNIFRGGEILNVSISTNHQFMFGNNRIGSNEVSLAGSLMFPGFLPFPTRMFRNPNIPRTMLKLNFNYQGRPEYTRSMISGSFGYTGNVRQKFSYQFNPLSISSVRLPYIDETFEKSLEKNPYLHNAYQNHFDMGVNGTVYYNSAGVSSANPKHSYWYTRLQLDLSGNLLALFRPYMRKDVYGKGMMLGAPFSQYVRAEASIGRTLIWGRKSGQALAMRLMAGLGYAYGNSVSMPFEKHFYGGGANSLRGWVARTLGPGTSKLQTEWIIPNQTGDMKIEANLEYRFLMFWKLSGAVFVDAGNIWNLDDENGESAFRFDTFGDSLAAAWGAGIRADLNFIVLRIDFGMRFHDPARDGSKWVGPDKWFTRGNNAIHFGVGYPF